MIYRTTEERKRTRSYYLTITTQGRRLTGRSMKGVRRRLLRGERFREVKHIVVPRKMRKSVPS